MLYKAKVKGYEEIARVERNKRIIASIPNCDTGCLLFNLERKTNHLPGNGNLASKIMPKIKAEQELLPFFTGELNVNIILGSNSLIKGTMYNDDGSIENGTFENNKLKEGSINRKDGAEISGSFPSHKGPFFNGRYRDINGSLFSLNGFINPYNINISLQNNPKVQHDFATQYGESSRLNIKEGNSDSRDNQNNNLKNETRKNETSLEVIKQTANSRPKSLDL